jgi:tRNA-2-methylthio-N6-dimethylallyladenosine synthase
VALDVRGQDPFGVPMPPFVARGARAHVTVMEGCSQVFSFCVVPRTRGTGVFRDPEDVLAEVRRHVEGGAQETVLLGQTINAYSHGETDFAGLLARCASVSGLTRLRFATSHPNYVTERLAATLGQASIICPHLHLPVQSGSDTVLAAMRRGYSRDEYLQKLALVRSMSRDIAVWTDIIVGYPGETDADFQATLDLIDVAGFAGLYAFTYSPRPGTTAFRLADDVPPRVKGERLAEVNRRQQDLQLASNQRRVGGVEEVLIDSVGRDGRLEGRAPDNRVVHCEGSPEVVGSILPVLVTSAGPNALVGRPASDLSA